MGPEACWFECGESSDGEKDCSFVAVNKFFTDKKRRDFTDPLFEKKRGKTVGSASVS